MMIISTINIFRLSKHDIPSLSIIFQNINSQKSHCGIENRLRHFSSNKKVSITPEKNLSTKVWTVPNLITLSRIILTPFIGYLIITERYEIALTGCILAGFSDWLDGYIAKKYHQQVTVKNKL